MVRNKSENCRNSGQVFNKNKVKIVGVGGLINKGLNQVN